MKYILIVRKLVLNNNIYYQVLDKAIGNSISDNYIKVVESNDYNEHKLGEINSLPNSTIGYVEIDEDFYKKLDLDNYLFFKDINNELNIIDDYKEENAVVYEFYKRFQDFKLIPDYDIEELIKEARSNLQKKIIDQDEAIERILTKIYNNQMFYEADLDYLDLKANKSNILLMGPYGSGKTTIKNIIKNSFDPIPIIEHKLIGDYKQDLTEIIRKLILQADGNMYLAERGIVIFDGINSFSSKFIDTDTESINIYLDTLEKILESSIVNIRFQDDKVVSFNYSLITNFCIVDVNYDYGEDDNKDDIYYSRIDSATLLELGFNPSFLIDCFDNEIIFTKEVDYDMAYSILKNKDISPLYKIKKSLENKGKTVQVSNDFSEKLIKFGLEFNEGMAGIIRTLKYVIQDKSISDKVITFNGDDFKKLKVGTCYVDSEDYEYTEETVKKKDLKQKEINDSLTVDVKNKTINGLSRKQTINLIKEKIKGQDEQIFNLVNTFFEFVLNKRTLSDFEYKETKDNILLIGGTGVGKTAIIETLSRIFSIPFKRVDATNYSGAGLVGNDIDSIFKELVDSCGGDPKRAENGIIFLDELDKIASNFDRADIGKGVQNALLTVVEGSIRTINPDHKEYFKPYDIDTSKILFIGAGAFEGINEIRNLRVKKQKNGTTLGFKEQKQDTVVNENITTDDIASYGIDRQLAGRLSNIINLNILGEEALYDIINSEQGYVNLKLKSYSESGVKIKMSEGFKKKLAKVSYDDKKGARSIKTVFKRVLNEIDKNNLDDDLEEVLLDDNSLDDYKSIQYVKKR